MNDNLPYKNWIKLLSKELKTDVAKAPLFSHIYDENISFNYNIHESFKDYSYSINDKKDTGLLLEKSHYSTRFSKEDLLEYGINAVLNVEKNSSDYLLYTIPNETEEQYTSIYNFNKEVILDNQEISEASNLIIDISKLELHGLNRLDEIVIFLEILNKLCQEKRGNKIIVKASIQTETIGEVSKVIALKIAAERFNTLYGSNLDFKWIVNTSYLTKAVIEIENNLVRNSIECFNALLCNPDFISITPHNYWYKSKSSDSLYLNSQIFQLLVHESKFQHGVKDMATNNVFINKGAEQLLSQAWSKFKESDVKQDSSHLETGIMQKKKMIGVHLQNNFKFPGASDVIDDFWNYPVFKTLYKDYIQ